MKMVDFSKVQLSHIDRVRSLLASNEVSHIRELIHHNKNRIIASCPRQLLSTTDLELEGHIQPDLRSCTLRHLANLASLYKFSYLLPHARAIKLICHKLQRFFTSHMTFIMPLLNNLEVKTTIGNT